MAEEASEILPRDVVYYAKLEEKKMLSRPLGNWRDVMLQVAD